MLRPQRIFYEISETTAFDTFIDVFSLVLFGQLLSVKPLLFLNLLAIYISNGRKRFDFTREFWPLTNIFQALFIFFEKDHAIIVF